MFILLYFFSRLSELLIVLGLFFTEGKVWQDNRRFTLRHLRDVGYARRLQDYELDVQTELQDLVNLIRNGHSFPHEEVRTLKQLIYGSF